MYNQYGTSETRDGDEIGAIMNNYRSNISPRERAAVTWTMGQIVQEENQRLVDYVKSNDPSWDYGRPIDKNILSDAIFGEPY